MQIAVGSETRSGCVVCIVALTPTEANMNKCSTVGVFGIQTENVKPPSSLVVRNMTQVSDKTTKPVCCTSAFFPCSTKIT